MILKDSDAYELYKKYAEKHVRTTADPLRTYSGWIAQFGYAVVDDDYEPFDFKEKPAAKSSTSVACASVCQKCGHKLDGRIGGNGDVCGCKCHDGRV